MVFNSLTFVVFFAIVLALHALPLPWHTKKLNLLVASYIFYAAWNPPFVVLLWISTLFDFWAARRVAAAPTEVGRRTWLAFSMALNLGFLGFFKYGEFLRDNFVAFAAQLGVVYAPPEWDIILPVGISFYTFQTMSYVLDVYLRRAEPTKSFLDFALFVTFFPQLVAGPIVRPNQLVPQFAEPRRADGPMFRYGIALVVLGLFEKVVLADGFLAPVAEAVFGARAPLPALDAWIGTLAFSGQIFCDFAGYSTIAIGTALCLGFHLPDNFRFPYAAVGFSDFWRRWHISLSTWLRDYLYVPLGGNRRGPARTYANLMLTMLLGGLWHGANWTFVVWGGLHGLYLAVERMLRARFGDVRLGVAALFALALVTWFFVNLAWVFFRAPTFAGAFAILRAMFGGSVEPRAVLAALPLLYAAVIVGGIFVTHWLMRERTVGSVVARIPAWLVAAGLGAMLFAVIIEQGTGDAFIYFQF